MGKIASYMEKMSIFVVKKMLMKIVYYLLSLLLLTACAQKRDKASGNPAAESVKLEYAEGFTIGKATDYTVVTVLNPWKEGTVYDRYYLVKKEGRAVPEDGKKILIPLKSMVANSATQLEFLQLLGVLDRVTGVCSSKYIYNPTILAGVADGKVKDLGDAFNLDMENLLLLRPQAVMTSAYNAEDENSKKMVRTGLNIIYDIEWQEKNLLGRAEWIKFIGAFFDKEALADSIFKDVEKNYNGLRQRVESLSSAPVVMSGQDFRGTWSMPAGKSFNAQLFRDAGARYFYDSDKTSGSIPSNLESALVNFRDADVWVGVQAASLGELAKADSKYKLFKAYKAGNVYNYNKRMNAAGGNDYWESAVARPDLLLSDMIKVFHPALLPGYELFYMQKLK